MRWLLLLVPVTLFLIFQGGQTSGVLHTYVAAVPAPAPSPVSAASEIADSKPQIAPAVGNQHAQESDGPKVIIAQVDNRQRASHAYLGLTSLANHLYSRAHPGHHYVYVSYEAASPRLAKLAKGLPPNCDHEIKGGLLGPRGCVLHPVWAKVKGMLTLMRQFPKAEYYIFLDSDATVSPQFAHLPWSHMLSDIEGLYNFSMKTHPVLLASEIRGWWENQCLGRNLSYAPNGGFIALRNDPKAHRFLQEWWASALWAFDEPVVGMTLPPKDFRTQHIGEQKMLTILGLQPKYNDTVAIIQPERIHGLLYSGKMPWRDRSASKCMFLMVEQACFFDHYYGTYKEDKQLHDRRHVRAKAGDLIIDFMAVLCSGDSSPRESPRGNDVRTAPVPEANQQQFRRRLLLPQGEEFRQDLCKRYEDVLPTFGNFTHKNSTVLNEARMNVVTWALSELMPAMQTLTML